MYEKLTYKIIRTRIRPLKKKHAEPDLMTEDIDWNIKAPPPCQHQASLQQNEIPTESYLWGMKS